MAEMLPCDLAQSNKLNQLDSLILVSEYQMWKEGWGYPVALKVKRS